MFNSFQVQRVYKKIIFYISLPLLFIGIIGGFISFTPQFLRNNFNNIEWPIGSIEAVHCNSNGHIYVTSKVYNRVQVYSAKGEFLRGWFIPTLRGFNLKMDDQDQIHILHAYDQSNIIYLIYSSGGKLVSREEVYHGYWDTFDKLVFSKNDQLSAKYTFDNKYYPEVFELLPDGTDKVVIKNQWYWLLFNYIFPGCFFIAISGLSILIYLYLFTEIRFLMRWWNGNSW